MIARAVHRASAAQCVTALALFTATATASAERPNVLPEAGSPSALSAPMCSAAATTLPPSVRVAPELVPRVRVMLSRSPTFRAQCQRFAENPWVHVKVRVEPHYIQTLGFRAHSVIQRPGDRLIVAVVTLQALADPAMWLSHELEHVLEQVDAVDLVRLADLRRGAWRSGAGTFETARAIRAGERVVHEVQANASRHNIVDQPRGPHIDVADAPRLHRENNQ